MAAKFNRIAAVLQTKIESGEYSDRLPSEQELATGFDTTTITVRKALEILLDRKLIRKIPSVGTFVNRSERKTIRIAWDRSVFANGGNEQIEAMVKARFSEFDIVFLDPATLTSPVAECDLIKTSATSRLSYSDGAAPFPLEVLARYRTDDYFLPAFDIHRVNEFFHALPLLFSPTLLRLDRDRVDPAFRSPGPYDMTYQLLGELGKSAAARKLPLWNYRTATAILRSVIFSDCGPAGRLAEVETESVVRKLKTLWPLFSPALIDHGDDDDRALLNWYCRQGLPEDIASGRYLLTAFPSERAGRPGLNQPTGEFIMLSNRSKSPAEAIRVAEFFLAPELQRLIGTLQAGLPVLKAAALDSIDSRFYRDDLFWIEGRNMMTNNAQEQEFLFRIGSFLQSVLAGGLPERDFLGLLEFEIRMGHAKCTAMSRDLTDPLLDLAGM